MRKRPDLQLTQRIGANGTHPAPARDMQLSGSIAALALGAALWLPSPGSAAPVSVRFEFNDAVDWLIAIGHFDSADYTGVGVERVDFSSTDLESNVSFFSGASGIPPDGVSSAGIPEHFGILFNDGVPVAPTGDQVVRPDTGSVTRVLFGAAGVTLRCCATITRDIPLITLSGVTAPEPNAALLFALALGLCGFQLRRVLH